MEFIRNQNNPFYEYVRDCYGDPRTHGFTVLKQYPEAIQNDIPDHLPDDIRTDFDEALDIIERSPQGAVGLFRKIVERTCNSLDSDNKGDRLSDRIRKLREDGKLTQEMAEWADTVRLDGNDAIHKEEPITKGQADQTRHFTYCVLLYLYTLPGNMANYRKAKQKKNQGKRRRVGGLTRRE